MGFQVNVHGEDRQVTIIDQRFDGDVKVLLDADGGEWTPMQNGPDAVTSYPTETDYDTVPAENRPEGDLQPVVAYTSRSEGTPPPPDPEAVTGAEAEQIKEQGSKGLDRVGEDDPEDPTAGQTPVVEDDKGKK